MIEIFFVTTLAYVHELRSTLEFQTQNRTVASASRPRSPLGERFPTFSTASLVAVERDVAMN